MAFNLQLTTDALLLLEHTLVHDMDGNVVMEVGGGGVFCFVFCSVFRRHAVETGGTAASDSELDLNPAVLSLIAMLNLNGRRNVLLKKSDVSVFE